MNDVPIYWTEADLTDTDAVVTASRPVSAAGEKDGWEVVLDRSPFFPGGGGQAADEGTIGGRRVLGVRRDSGIPVFLLEGTEPVSAGSTVRCQVDQVCRRRSRQTHSGQHLISAALAAEGLDTLSVHLGREYCGIEVNADTVGAPVIERVLDTCDRVIGEDRPIESLLLDPAELENIPLRRPLSPKAGGMEGEDEEEGLNAGGSRSTVRVVAIRGFDAVGCGGVHLTRTSAIRLVLFDGSERIRGRLRLRWLIGDEASRRCRMLAGQGRALTGLLSVPLEDLAGRAGELAAELREVKGLYDAAEREIGRLMAAAAVPGTDAERAGPVPAADGAQAAVPSSTAAAYPSPRPAQQALQPPPPPGKRICLAVGGGAVRLESALEELRGAGVTTAFLVGSPGTVGDAPWVLYHSGGEELFQEMKEHFLPGVQGKGGGRPPMMRGRLGCAPEEALARFRRLRA
jgi:alanyl-tRNA synthetase